MSTISRAMRIAEATRRLNAIYAELARLRAEQVGHRSAIAEIHAKLGELREEASELRRQTGAMVEFGGS